MTIKYNRRTMPYKALLTFILIVEMHYFGLFTLPQGLEFIVYTNKSKWIGAVAVIVAFLCLKNHKSTLKPYMGFLRKYLTVVTISIILISLYTIIVYPLNPLITTYGFASYYLYAFLAVPILYIYIVEGGYESFFDILNAITVVKYVITIVNGVAFIKNGTLLFTYSSLDLSGGLIRDGKVRLSSGALGFLMMIYNFYVVYSQKNTCTARKNKSFAFLIIGLLSIYFTGNSRLMLLTLLMSVGILVMLGDGSKRKKIIAVAAIIVGIDVLLSSGAVSNFLNSFSSSGTLGGSSIARAGAYQYYLSRFIKNPLFANGFVGDENYYNIVHGDSGIYYQTVLVRYYYDDVGIAGQLALLGIFIIGIYIWPILRIAKLALRMCKNARFYDGKFVMAVLCYLVCTTPTLIILDAGRVIAFPIIIATGEYIYIDYLKKYNANKMV